MKTWNSIVTVLALVFSASALFAAAPWNGSGMKDDPFQIADEAGLRAVSEKVKNQEYIDSSFKVMQDITLSKTSFTPIGTYEKPFLGNFDGDGHIISGLYIAGFGFYQGLFGRVDTGVLSNIKLENVDITGYSGVGSLCGCLENGAVVQNCSVTGKVTGRYNIGGLIGYTTNKTIVRNCSANVTVMGTEDGFETGGLIGQAVGIVTNCYAAGSVSGIEKVGGLIGVGWAISNCYSIAAVTGVADTGALLGSGTKRVTNCYFNKDGGLTDSSSAAGKTSGEMKMKDFIRTLGVEAWNFDKEGSLNNGYPVLAWQGGTPIPNVPIFTPASCEFSGSLSVTLSALPAGASVYYAQKADLSDSKLYTAPFAVTQTCTIYAVSILGEEISPVSSSVYTKSTAPIVVESPEFFPASQSYSTPALTVTLINKTADAKMEYGFRADLSDAKAYKSPFSISGTQTVYARAKLAESVSSVSSATYTFIQPKPAAVVVLGTKVEVTADSFHLTDPLSKKKTKLEALYSELFPKPGKVAKQKKMNVKMVSDTAFEDKGIVRLLNQKLYKQALKNALTNTTAKVLAADSGIWAVQKDSAVMTVTVKLKGKNRSDAIWIKTVPPTLDSYRFVDSVYLVVSVKNAGAKPKAFFEYLDASRANVLKLKKMTVSFLPEKKWAKTGIDFKTFFPGKDIAVFKTSAKKVEKLPAVHDLVLDNKNGLGVK